MEKQTTVMPAEELQSLLGLKGGLGLAVSKAIIKIIGLDEINRIQGKYSELAGPEFAARVLEEVGVSWELPVQDLANIPSEGGFITVSNHSYGSIDGLLLSAVVGGRRPDYKILTTFLLSKIPGLSDSFIGVDNFSSGGARSIQGIRIALGHIADGNASGFFPAGEVATWQKKDKRTAGGRVIEDCPWAENIIKMIRRSKLPVVPIYFDGGNSRLFHLLGLLHPRLRTVRLIREMLNKDGLCVKMRIGKPILPFETEGMDVAALGGYLRARCYALESECRESGDRKAEASVPVAAGWGEEKVRAEIERISDRMVFEQAGYRCYLTRSDDVPAIMHELGRLREITFRGVGEGTGLELDLDSFDGYYRQLVLWHVADGCIAGAYRIGIGSEIMLSKGVGGFYTSTLFRYQKGAEAFLSQCMELGRSFVVEKYQREFLPLRLLMTGILRTVMQYPDVKFFIGPVSISGEYPDLYKSLMVKFLTDRYGASPEESIALPEHPHKPDFLRVDPSRLLFGLKDPDDLDKLFSSMSDGEWRVPPLVRAYVSWGAKFITFNVDPDFNNSLDGLILSRLSDFPPRMLDMLFRSLEPEERESIKERFR